MKNKEIRENIKSKILDLDEFQKVLTDVVIIGKDKKTGKNRLFTLEAFIKYFEKKLAQPSKGKGE